jgi:DNA-binding Lrp family transcriptional regulator
MNRVTRGLIKWTPEMDRELVNLLNYGIHKNEVAERLGTSVAAAESRYRRLKKGQVK